MIMVGLVMGYGWWLEQDEEYEVMGIKAPMDEAARLPVYAQFVVTQKLVIEKAEITRILLPVYLVEAGPEFAVVLKQREEEIKRWKIDQANQELMAGNNNLTLLLDEPRLMEGSMEIIVDGSMIEYESRGAAPQVFIEKEDDYYPEGNYRIADNEKLGDMAVEIKARQTRRQSVLKRFAGNKLAMAAWVAARLVLAMAVGSLPVVLWGGRFKLV